MNKGLTFIDIIIVVGITSIIVSAGVVGLTQLQSVFKLRSSGDEIRSLLQLGRELAVANKDQQSYSVSLNSGTVILRSGSGEISRYQSPAGIVYNPASFSWSFAPLSGLPSECSLPCQLTLTFGDNTEIIFFQKNGIVN